MKKKKPHRTQDKGGEISSVQDQLEEGKRGRGKKVELQIGKRFAERQLLLQYLGPDGKNWKKKEGVVTKTSP